MRYRNGQTREDLVAIIEEMLHQRIRGVKNEKGVWITPAFPKLIYVLEEDNIHEGQQVLLSDKACCRVFSEETCSRLYFREEVMKELKDGNCYPCMGCQFLPELYIMMKIDKPQVLWPFQSGCCHNQSC